MKLTFLGANRQVTGSSYLLEAGGLKIMIDHGMFQEREFLWRNWEPCPIPASQIDVLLLTHAHIDHVGRLPRLVAEGFRGPIITTEPSIDLSAIVLDDSARIQEEDVAYKRKRHSAEGRRDPRPAVPLYTVNDVKSTLPLMKGVGYNRPVPLNDNVTATFFDAGHILGSSMILIEAEGKRIVFSGDIGQKDKPLIGDPSTLQRADYVVMESTYGDHDHRVTADAETALADAVNRTAQAGGNLVVPTFAVERAQELVYYMGRLVRSGRIARGLPMFVDSPMAVDVTAVFLKYKDWLDETARQMLESGEPPLRFPGLTLSRTVDQSKAINDVRPAVIMAPSGMCTAGRIKHHLAHNITDPRSTVLFVGFQGTGTLGRQIVEGAKQVRIHGRFWAVRARVEKIEGLSAHADRSGLLRWLGNFQQPPRRLFLTHGEERPALSLAEKVAADLKWGVTVPEYRQTVDLA